MDDKCRCHRDINSVPRRQETPTMFSRSIAANVAALIVIDAAKKGGFMDSPIAVSEQLAEDEKKLIVKVLAKLNEVTSSDKIGLTPDEIGSVFTFVFAKAAEAVTALGNHMPFEFDLQGLLDGKATIAADDRITGKFKELDFPAVCAQNFWNVFAEKTEGNFETNDPKLALGEALKWCFRISCHIAMRILPEHF